MKYTASASLVFLSHKLDIINKKLHKKEQKLETVLSVFLPGELISAGAVFLYHFEVNAQAIAKDLGYDTAGFI